MNAGKENTFLIRSPVYMDVPANVQVMPMPVHHGNMIFRYVHVSDGYTALKKYCEYITVIHGITNSLKVFNIAVPTLSDETLHHLS